MDVTLVGLVSSYKEGRLIQGAVRSLLPGCDHVYLFDGPAGRPLSDEVPETDLGSVLATDPRLHVHTGRWRTDARKRTAMLEHARSRHASPLWVLWLDGDELLLNGEHLRDWLQVLQWHDEQHPDEQPHLGKPLRMVELDGAIVWTRGRLIRGDLIRNYEVSIATFVNDAGVLQGGGNFPDRFDDWHAPRRAYFEQGQRVQEPPISGEPHVLHRSMLRHPLRRGLRMHEQEAAELALRKPAQP